MLDSQRDVIILDVNSSDVSLGMSCPPAAFVDADFLKSVNQILKPSGKVFFYFMCVFIVTIIQKFWAQ